MISRQTIVKKSFFFHARNYFKFLQKQILACHCSSCTRYSVLCTYVQYSYGLLLRGLFKLGKDESMVGIVCTQKRCDVARSYFLLHLFLLVHYGSVRHCTVDRLELLFCVNYLDNFPVQCVNQVLQHPDGALRICFVLQIVRY